MAQSTELNISPELIAEAVKRAIGKLGQEGAGKNVNNPTGKLDAMKDYPLAEKRSDLVKSDTGKPLDGITLDKVVSGEVTFADIKISPQTLEYQAQIAESIHRPHIAGNLRRAAEMTKIPDQRILEMYDALRPYRKTKQELLDMANELESKFQAKICAGFVREAANVYEQRGRLKR